MKLLRILSIVLLVILSVSAIAGGLILIIDPTGDGMQLPIEHIQHSPFKDYFFPGIILFSTNGVSALIVLIVVIIKSKYYPWFIIYQGSILVGWIAIQMMMLQVIYFLQFILGTIGIIMITAGIIQARSKKYSTK